MTNAVHAITITRQFCHTGRYEVRVNGAIHSRWMLESDALAMGRLLRVKCVEEGPGLAKTNQTTGYHTSEREPASR